MLPRELSDELCSLMANETRPALVCYIETDLDGNITAKPHFVSAYVQSKAKLAYNKIFRLFRTSTGCMATGNT